MSVNQTEKQTCYDDGFYIQALEKYGDVGMWLLPTLVGGYGFISGNKMIPISITLAGLIQKLAVEHLKKLFPKARPRPFRYGIISKEDQESFPSSHTAGAFLSVGLSIGIHGVSSVFTITTLILASLVGLSRILSQKHWTLDVTSGAAIGTLSGFAATKLFA